MKVEAIQVCGGPVVDRPMPVRVRNRVALIAGNRDQRALRVEAKERLQIRDLQAAVQCGHVRRGDVPHRGEMQVVRVEVNDVKSIRLLADPLDHGQVRGRRIAQPAGLA